MNAPAIKGTPAGARIWGAVAVVLAASVPYLSTVQGYFLQEDFGNIQLFASTPWSMFPRWFTMPWTGTMWGYVPDEIRPFTALVFQMTTVFGATAVVPGHLLNYALHAANSLLVVQIARSAAGFRQPAAIFTGLVFALLPVQAESVAWLSGRVDSLPALFYLATFLAYVRWRLGGSSAEASAKAGLPTYAVSLALFFVALFTKQTTITMVATLVLYDWIIGNRPPRPSWRWVAPYVPFAALTAGYLVLRYVVVGTMIRESRLNLQNMLLFQDLFARHLRRVVLGEAGPVSALAWVGAAFIVVMLIAVSFSRSGRRPLARAALCLGPVWWLVGVAPVLVAGYESPRHVYLASMGWAILLGAAVEWGSTGVRPGSDRGQTPVAWRWAGAICAVAVVVFYLVKLIPVVREWNTAAAISKNAAARLEREAMAAPPGSLVIIGVPIRIWEWAFPFVARPPFTQTDLTGRTRILAPQRLWCCQAPWFDASKAMLREWLASPEPRPIVALYVDPRSGAIARLTDSERPDLRAVVSQLAETDSAETLDQGILDVLRKLLGGR
jgi:hypothetical protein